MARRFGRGLDGAFDRVDEVHRRMHRRHFRHNHQPPMFFGFVLVGLGVLFLLDNLNLLETRDVIRTFWPTVIIGWGVVRLFRTRGGERLMGAVAVFVGSLFLGNQLFDWDVSVMAIFWPLILIAFGISILSRAWGGVTTVQASVSTSAPGAAGVTDAGGAATGDADPDARVDTSSTIKEFAVMAGVERKNISQTFRGGDVTAAMGSVEIDLRECRMAAEDVQVSVSVFLGEIVLRIPRDWTVDSRVAVVMASLEDRSEPPVGTSSPKRLVLTGSAFMGNVEIRN